MLRRDRMEHASRPIDTLTKVSDSEICHLSAFEMAAMIRTRKLSAREVLDAHLARIDDVNPKLNAIVTLDRDGAIARANAADESQARGETLGPLQGLPIAHKDLLETAGIRTTFGSPIFADYVPTQNALLVDRLQHAGAITIGKTNTPEFGAGSQTFNKIFGATRNPYDPSKTCGGSSGGAAVALATGMLPIADGSDAGGSLRNPAAFCGVVGLRPAPGRVAQSARGFAWSTIPVLGPMARNVRDCALLLSVMAGYDPRCPISINESGHRFSAPLDRDFKGTRVAWFRNMDNSAFAPRIADQVNAQRRVFADLGCIIDEIEPAWRGVDEAFQIFRALGFQALAAELPAESRSQLKDTIQWEIERGLKLTAFDLARARTPPRRRVGSHAHLSADLRILHRAQHAGPAVRYRNPISNGNRGRENELVYRMDALLLSDFDAGMPINFRALRTHA